MPTPCNLFVTDIPGSSEKEGRDGSSDIFEVEHEISQPVDIRTGHPTGVRIHNPLRVLKTIDKATPGFFKALCQGTNLAEVRLEYFRIDPASRAETKYYVVKLTNARIVNIKPYMPVSFQPANEYYRHMEQVSFSYEMIEWSWLPDNMVESDEWRRPGSEE